MLLPFKRSIQRCLPRPALRLQKIVGKCCATIFIASLKWACVKAVKSHQLLYCIVQDGPLLIDEFDGVVVFKCTVCHGDSLRTLRVRYYRLDTKKLTSSSFLITALRLCNSSTSLH